MAGSLTGENNCYVKSITKLNIGSKMEDPSPGDASYRRARRIQHIAEVKQDFQHHLIALPKTGERRGRDEQDAGRKAIE